VKTVLQIILFILFCDTTLAEIICSRNSDNAALVVIDMQPFFVRSPYSKVPENIQKVEEVLNVQIEAIRHAKKNGLPIIFIEYYHHIVKIGETSEKLKSEVKDYSEVKFSKKTTDDMFDASNSFRADLVEYLKKNNVGTLIVTGANGGACVRKSIQGALDSNCNVFAYNKGIADFSYPKFIYPYIGQYSTSIKPNCRDCTFQEVSGIDDIKEALLSQRNKFLNPTVTKELSSGLESGAQ